MRIFYRRWSQAIYGVLSQNVTDRYKFLKQATAGDLEPHNPRAFPAELA
jgi:hypothetical protein